MKPLRHNLFTLTLATLLVLSMSALSAGCATICADSEDIIQFDSEPTGAMVSYHGNDLGRTPIKVKIPRETGATYVSFALDGYRSTNAQLTKTIDGRAFLNIFFIFTTLGASSWGTDLTTGKLQRYAPNKYVVTLKKLGAKGADEEAFIIHGNSLEFIASHFQEIRNDLARGGGESLRSLCAIYGRLSPASCARFMDEVAGGREGRDAFLSQPDGLALFRLIESRRAINLTAAR